MTARLLLALVGAAGALPSLPSIPDRVPNIPDPRQEEPPAAAEFTVPNHCDRKAPPTYPKGRKTVHGPTPPTRAGAPAPG